MKPLPYTYAVKDRYWYFRHPNTGQIRLEGEPFSPHFMWHYRRLFAKSGAKAKRAKARKRVRDCERRVASRGRDRVYFIGAEPDGPIKIGFARDVEERLGTLQVASAQPLRLLAAIPGGPTLEREYHDRFAPLRLRGEWFQRTGAILAEIENISGQKGVRC